MEGIGNSEGVGEVKDPGNSRGEGDWMLDSLSKILSCLQSRSFTWKKVAWILVFELHYNIICNEFSFFKKHVGS